MIHNKQRLTSIVKQHHPSKFAKTRYFKKKSNSISEGIAPVSFTPDDVKGQYLGLSEKLNYNKT